MAINRTLIEGQRLMREAGKDTRGESLVKGFSTVLAAGIAERKAIKATADKYMEDLGGIENMNLIEPSQRGAVTDFLRTKRDEFNDLATQHAENPSSELRDKMDAIKFQFQTVNNQLKTYMDKRKEYLSDRDEGNLQTNGSFEKDNTFFESTYGNPDSAFSIDYETGKISFTGNNGTDSETRSLDDFGTHTLRNYEAEASTSMIFSNAKKTKWGGGLFDKDGVSQQFVFKHRGQGADEIQSLIQTDLSGDDSDFGFMQQWANGDLIDKSLYDGFEANKDGTYDASWMLDNANKQKVLDTMGKFIGNVSEDIYNNSAENPETVRKRNQANSIKDGVKGLFEVPQGTYGNAGYIAHRSDSFIRKQAADIDRGKKIINFGDETFVWEQEDDDGTFTKNRYTLESPDGADDGALLTKHQVADRMDVNVSLIKSENPDIIEGTYDIETGTDYTIMEGNAAKSAENWNKSMLPKNHAKNPKGYYFAEYRPAFGDRPFLDPLGLFAPENTMVLMDKYDNLVSYKNLREFKNDPNSKKISEVSEANPPITFDTGGSDGANQDEFAKIIKQFGKDGYNLLDAGDGL